jgi:phosphoribosylformimino-5-aminoimidazole carboxamide ribotide isomerase
MIDLDDPIAVARKWEDEGFATLHVVDLDAATGRGSNAELVERILCSGTADMQVGGGLRSIDSIQRMLDAGAARVVLGTRALKDREWLEEAATTFPHRVVVAADVCGSSLVTDGWTNQSPRDLEEVIGELNSLRLAGLLVTAVHKEGLMEGPDLSLMRAIVQMSHVPIHASGGITSIDDIRSLADLGVSVAIVGMALYTGALTGAQVEEAFG